MNTLTSINNDYQSYQAIINFYHAHKDKYFEDIPLNIERFFAANMSAALGAVLDLLIANINDIHFQRISYQIEQILLKNNFLGYYGGKYGIDTYHTTIKFQKLKPSDGKFFKQYIVNELIGRNELPHMSEALKEKIAEGIYEIFVNAQIHSGTDYIYTCGQFFPNKNNIEFTIADTGIGFREKVNQRFGSLLAGKDAILWAVKDRHTTKTNISGGIGLALLKEFIHINKGKLQIISDNGFYQYSSVSEFSRSFDKQFPGTIVNLQFCTNDTNNYSLQTEIDNNDIF